MHINPFLKLTNLTNPGQSKNPPWLLLNILSIQPEYKIMNTHIETAHGKT